MFLLILEREDGFGVGRERERETPVGCLPYVPQPGNQTRNLGMCFDWKSNLQPFGVWMMLQPTQPPSQSSLLFQMKIWLQRW